MITADRILVTLPPSGSARVSSMAAREKLTTPEMAARLLDEALDREPPVTLDIARALSPEERRRLDSLALSHGTSPEGQPVQTFRLKMPEKAKRKLEEHAEALGCRAGELAAFLFSKQDSRPQATLAGG
ncbi:MAG: hypothetical protein V4726_15960 [Verrucomicrobiota bacterium]